MHRCAGAKTVRVPLAGSEGLEYRPPEVGPVTGERDESPCADRPTVADPAPPQFVVSGRSIRRIAHETPPNPSSEACPPCLPAASPAAVGPPAVGRADRLGPSARGVEAQRGFGALGPARDV